MKFKEGKTVDKFFVEKNGKKIEVIFRYPKMSDAKQLMDFINKAIRETEFLAKVSKVKLSEEKKWLKDVINEMRKGEEILIVVEANGKIIGDCSVKRNKKEVMRHIGVLAIALLQDYTGLGIGSRLAKRIFEEAKKNGIEIIESSYYAKNNPSKKFHKKLGFKIIGVFPKGIKRKGKYSDHVIVYKNLK